MGDGADYLVSCGINQWSDVDYRYHQRIVEDIGEVDIDDEVEIHPSPSMRDVLHGAGTPFMDKARPSVVYLMKLRHGMLIAHDEDGLWLSYWYVLGYRNVARSWSKSKRQRIYRHQVGWLFGDVQRVITLFEEPSRKE